MFLLFILSMAIYFVIYLIICVLPGVMVAGVIISLIKRKLEKLSENLITVIYIIITFVCVFTSVTLGNKLMIYLSEKPDREYVEMSEINDNNSLIGLSKQEVYDKLGTPQSEHYGGGSNYCEYDAGAKTNEFFFGEKEFYKFRIFFDENDKVKNTSIKESD